MVLRYLEDNPLRAGMVLAPDDYPWSSYLPHGQGCADALLNELPVALRVRGDAAARQRWWRKWVHTPLNEKELSAVRPPVASGRPLGSPSWTERLARQLNIALSTRPRGRSRKAEQQ